MPELPDVEVFRRRLSRDGLDRPVARVELSDSRALRDASRQQLSTALRGRRLTTTRRHGKHLFAAIEGGARWLVLHFGMTGSLLPLRHGDERPGHPRLVLHFDDLTRLVYDDQRRLGFVSLTDDVDTYVAAQDLGPDALELSFTEMRERVRSRRGGLKSALMDQSLIAGIGNIYSDEICFHARLHPRVAAADLDDASCRRLHRQTGRVLRMAADRDADPARMPDSWLLPHREDGAPCPRGNGEIRKISVSGRGAFYCTGCQPASG